MIGTRGIPARYGGSETCVEEVGARLVEFGHEVIAYCRRHNSQSPESTFRGIRRVVLPSYNRKSLDTPPHSLPSVLHALIVARADAVHLHGVRNSMVLPLISTAGKSGVP